MSVMSDVRPVRLAKNDVESHGILPFWTWLYQSVRVDVALPWNSFSIHIPGAHQTMKNKGFHHTVTNPVFC